MAKEQAVYCECCGARLNGRWEKLTPGIVRSLVKMWSAVVRLNRNNVHLQKDVDFDKNEYNNFQKLRYFGLVAKVDGQSGHWLITRNGGRFIHGLLGVHTRVKIKRNHIVERSTETWRIYDVLKTTPYWPQRMDFFREDPVDRGGLFDGSSEA